MRINKLLKAIFSVVLIQIMCVSCNFGQSESAHNEEGEESGKRYDKNEVCEDLRKGTKLILKYDESALAFVGTVENVSTKVIKKVRVEVHLSNGVELGPTKKVNLVPGEKTEINLSAKGQSFEWWSTHAETGNSEHGHGENGEHGQREKGEHSHVENGEHN